MTDKTQSEPCRICKKPASEHASDGCNHNHAIHDHDFAVTDKTQDRLEELEKDNDLLEGEVG